MRTIYLDCSMGAAGDMLTASLLGLCPDRDGFISEMNAVFAGKARVYLQEVSDCGICGLHIGVDINGDEEGHEHNHEHHHHHHHHTDLHELLEFIASVPLSEKVRADAAAVFSLIAEAEAAVHGAMPENIHFHEVGSLDAMADVLCVCRLIEKLGPEKILASAVNVGSGTVKCAHGVLPVPAPATEILLRGIPCYSSEIKTELCTPTGAALLKHFVSEFCAQPVMTVESCAYGMGTKKLERLNALRALLGETGGAEESVTELRCNIDDMTGEELGFAMERLFDCGALDVWFTPVYMKKNRPATMLSCLCRTENKSELTACLFKHTSTLGIREYRTERTVAQRSCTERETALGSIHIKQSAYGEKPEFDDLSRIAKENNMSLREVRKLMK